jgi:hypothetical protein
MFERAKKVHASDCAATVVGGYVEVYSLYFDKL